MLEELNSRESLLSKVNSSKVRYCNGKVIHEKLTSKNIISMIRTTRRANKDPQRVDDTNNQIHHHRGITKRENRASNPC